MSWQDEASRVLRSHVPVGSRLLVAVSGGPDSVALAHFLRQEPYALFLGHVDHQLRKDSSQDARFVQRLARQWDVPCVVKRASVKSYAKTQQVGIEEAARDMRYQKLAAIAQRAHCSALITGHTADDQSETVLMNFLRGSGPLGLSGMPRARPLHPASSLPLVRPFLGVRRKQILVYLQTHSLDWRHDASNDSLRFARNRIRHKELPYLEKRNPGLRERLAQTADILRSEEDFWSAHVIKEWRKTVRRNRQGFTVVLPRLLGYHKALSRRILRRVLPGTSFQDIEQVFQLARSPEKAWLEFPGGWLVRRRRQRLEMLQKRTG